MKHAIITLITILPLAGPATADDARVRVVAEVDNLDPVRTVESEIDMSINFGDKNVTDVRLPIMLSSGVNYVEHIFEISAPQLWWPNGVGDQPLYAAGATVVAGSERDESIPVQFGIRIVELDISPVDDGERAFAVVVNGKRIFCRGGNWIPADSIYARVTDEKYETLIEEAREANFNMLRIWGGGIYERDIFFETCDRLGILV